MTVVHKVCCRVKKNKKKDNKERIAAVALIISAIKDILLVAIALIQLLLVRGKP